MYNNNIWNTYHDKINDFHLFWYELSGMHFVEAFKGTASIERKQFNSEKKACIYFDTLHFNHYRNKEDK